MEDGVGECKEGVISDNNENYDNTQYIIIIIIIIITANANTNNHALA